MNYSYGMDYQGGGGDASAGGFPNTNESGGRERRSYDDQTIIPVTCHMIQQSRQGETSEASGRLELEDGRELHHVKLVAAIREVEYFSTNALLSIEDGTGLLEVKQWVDQNAAEEVQRLRQAALQSDIYVKIIGVVKNDGDGKRSIVTADGGISVRPLKTGNELAHHMLEVVYSGEKHARNNKNGGVQPMTVTSNGVGFGRPLRAAGVKLNNATTPDSSPTAKSSLSEAVMEYFRNNDNGTSDGAAATLCVEHFVSSGGHTEADIRTAIANLRDGGLIYSTTDEEHYKVIEF